MGMRFNLDHASIVGWLTQRKLPLPAHERDWEPSKGHWDPSFRDNWLRQFWSKDDDSHKWRAPRVLKRVLFDFLDYLPESIVTSSPTQNDFLYMLIDQSRQELRLIEGNSTQVVLPAPAVARILAPLRNWFSVPFYFMPIGTYFPLDYFRYTGEFTLWLQCEDRGAETARDLLDPFPALRQLFLSSEEGPATVCWTWGGDTAIIPQRVASTEKVIEMARHYPPWRLWPELKQLHKSQIPVFNLIQLSDLHFGASTVSKRNLIYVEQHLRNRIEDVVNNGGLVQPVITGDLMDDPIKKNLEEFEAFRNRIAAYAKTDVVIIPGNHDTRKKGFLWKKMGALAQLEWSNIVVSDICKVVFICFDTSRDAQLAQGCITDDQFLEVSTKLKELQRRNDSWGDFINIALVHHHPFSTREDEIDTLPLGIKEEPFLRMENGDHLIQWCGRNDIPLILHGHKHRPRFIGQEIEIDGRTRLVRAIGCGSTLGIEKKPLSFNWITWQPNRRQWTVTYCADPGDGSGFQEKRLVIGS